jgi:hypothetical protein
LREAHVETKSIKAKLWLLIGTACGVCISVAGFLTYSLKEVSANYDDIFEREVRVADLARQIAAIMS